MNARVFWAIVIGFLLGVLVRSLIVFGWSVLAFIALLALASVLVTFFDAGKRRVGILCAVVLVSFAGGALRMQSAALSADPTLSSNLERQVTIEGRVFDEPDVRESNVRLSVRADTITYDSATSSVRAGVLVIAPLHTAAQYGDRVRAKGELRLPESFAVGTTVPSGSSRAESREVEGKESAGRAFNYSQFLAKEGIVYELAFVREIERIGETPVNPVKVFAIALKHTFLEGLGVALPEPQAGLAGGITVGDKRGLGSDLSDVFRTVGLIHIVVLSGYNIMIVMEGLSRLLSWFSVSRYIRFGASVFIAVLFALMTGLAAASVRAAAMAIIAVVGRISGRMYLASRALGLVAAGMVLWNPYILAYDPGFQLSVLATAGLIAFTPIVVTRLKIIPTKLGLREIAATTLGTQLAVLPLLLYQSGQIPIFSLPANMLALVAVPFAMLLSAFAALAGLMFPALSSFVGFPAYALLSYIIGIADLFAALPFSSIAIPAFSVWWLLGVYGLMLVWVLKYGRTRTGESINEA